MFSSVEGGWGCLVVFIHGLFDQYECYIKDKINTDFFIGQVKKTFDELICLLLKSL